MTKYLMNEKIFPVKYHQVLPLALVGLRMDLSLFRIFCCYSQNMDICPTQNIDQMEMFVVSFGVGLRLIIFILTCARPARV